MIFRGSISSLGFGPFIGKKAVTETKTWRRQVAHGVEYGQLTRESGKRRCLTEQKVKRGEKKAILIVLVSFVRLNRPLEQEQSSKGKKLFHCAHHNAANCEQQKLSESVEEV